ncbi:MAG TPA: hypothetical protein VFR32_00220 [Gaiellaceae bacterium]|nr:hypothetical protein [Gaiellaceae bacterium]
MRRLVVPALALGAAVGVGFGYSATETIEITARPTVLRWTQSMIVAGGVGSGRAGVDVYLESRACDEQKWELVAGPHTDDAGRFAVELGASVNLLLRARADGATSNLLAIKQRPSVTLQQRPKGTFWVHVNATRPLYRRTVVLQRFDPSRRTWRAVRSARLTQTGSNPGSPFVWSRTEKFRATIPRQTLLRATLPLQQARPCYVGGYSNLLRR